jgi:hypothetical protein
MRQLLPKCRIRTDLISSCSSYLPPQFNNIPDELKALKRWNLWGPVQGKRNKPLKMPLQLTGWQASVSQPNRWSTLPAVRIVYETAAVRGYMEYRNKERVHQIPLGGIGFVFDDSTPDADGYVYVGIDFDNVLTPAGEIIDPDVAKWIERFDSYTERSVSGTGLHVIVKAPTIGRGISVKLNGGCHGREAYSQGRYFTFTGDVWGGHSEIAPAPDAVVEFVDELENIERSNHQSAAPVCSKSNGAAPPWTDPRAVNGHDISATTRALIARVGNGHESFSEKIRRGAREAQNELGAGIESDKWFDALDYEGRVRCVVASTRFLAKNTRVFADYDTWLTAGFALARSLKEEQARKIFVACSMHVENADSQEELERKFNNDILPHVNDRGNGTTVGTLIKWARDAGFDFSEWKNAKALAATVTGNTVETLPLRSSLVPGAYPVDAALALFRSHICYAKAPGMFAKSYVQIMNDGTLEPYARKQLSEAFENYSVNVTTIDGRSIKAKLEASALTKWYCQHPQRRDVTVVFKPIEAISEHEYNLWQGYGVQRDAGRHWMMPFLDHLWVNICSKRIGVFAYVINWLAHAVQHPDQPMPVALILYGREMGTGKSFVGKIMCKLVGEMHARQATLDDLMGKFNDHTIMWSFWWFDEIYFDMPERERFLRGALTSGTRRVELKGGAVFHPRNYMHPLITNNAELPMPVRDGDRLYCSIKVGTRNIKDRRYFKGVEDCLDAGGYGQLLDFLLQIDLTGWNPEAIPDTDEREDQKLMSADELTQWLLCCVEDGAVTGSTKSVVTEGQRLPTSGPWPLGGSVPAKDLRDAFYGFCKQRGISKPPGTREVSNRLTEIFGKSETARVKGTLRTEKQYELPADAGELQDIINAWRKSGVVSDEARQQAATAVAERSKAAEAEYKAERRAREEATKAEAQAEAQVRAEAEKRVMREEESFDLGKELDDLVAGG